jgi:hypothetical protein
MAEQPASDGAFRSSGQEPQNDPDSETEMLSPPSRSTITSRHAGSKCLSRSWPDSRTPYPAPVRRGLPLLHACTSIGSACIVTVKSCKLRRALSRPRCAHRASGRPSPSAAASRAVGGTHKGHQCQEGVRTWPGDYARRRAGLTVFLDPSSRLPGSSCRAARVRLERPEPRSGEDERA